MPHPTVITSALLDWIAAGRRDLPWRRGRAPYAVWISEVMLQQTQVASVTPYFERWLIRFPSVRALAEAPLDDVLKAWEGLGYYARARNLQAAAQEIVAQHGGEIPADREALLRLPGVGRYTAGAILSLAFGKAEPILDGNVRRVLCRVDDIADEPKAPATERRLWERADALVKAAPAGRTGDLNEALMELGALICTPGKPDCATCPLAESCLAHARGVEAERPVKTARKQPPHYDVTAALIQDPGGWYLIVRRPAEGLLGGLWGFPGSAAGDCNAPVTGSGALAICLADALRDDVGHPDRGRQGAADDPPRVHPLPHHAAPVLLPDRERRTPGARLPGGALGLSGGDGELRLPRHRSKDRRDAAQRLTLTNRTCYTANENWR